jgi:Transposase and inactivated derivatives, IS30 family
MAVVKGRRGPRRAAWRRLTHPQRQQLETLRGAGCSLRQIGLALGVSKSTVYRELRRNRVGGRYTAREAQSLADARLGNSARARVIRSTKREPQTNQDN